MARPVAWYREFAPCAALQADIYSLFSFVPGSIPASTDRVVLRQIAFDTVAFCSPQFADGHVSIVFELGQQCDAAGHWHVNPGGGRGTVIGPMSHVGRTEGDDRPEMIGAYFRPARVGPFLRVALADLTDEAVAIDDVWGAGGTALAAALCELDEGGRLDRLEAALLARLGLGRERARSVNVEGLTASVLRFRGRTTVNALAGAAGVSRQHLAREFRDRLGVSPKLYCRLARFQSGLAHAGRRARVDWAQVATDLGYADQSHMIAEFRQFSGLTPQVLADAEWFHPFIERARSAPTQSTRGEGLRPTRP